MSSTTGPSRFDGQNPQTTSSLPSNDSASQLSKSPTTRPKSSKLQNQDTSFPDRGEPFQEVRHHLVFPSQRVDERVRSVDVRFAPQCSPCFSLVGCSRRAPRAR